MLKRFNHHVTARDCLQLDLSVGLPVPRPELTEFHSFGSRSMSALLVDQITHYTSQHGEDWTCVCTIVIIILCVQMSLQCDLFQCG